MAVTAIRSIRNSHETDGYFVRNHENPNDTGGRGKVLPVGIGEVVQCNMWIPWCTSQDEFKSGHHISITPLAFNFVPVMFQIWQDGDYVRYSKDGLFHDNGDLVPGNNTIGGNRSIQIVGPDPKNADLSFY